MDESFSASPLPPVPPSPPAAPITLYDPQVVGLATFLGSPLAGCLIMAVNFKRLGSMPAAIATIVLGAAATALLVGLGFLLPARGASIGISVGALLAMIMISRRLQGPVVELHRIAGGRIGSAWMGVLAAAGVVAIGVLGVVAYTFLVPPLEGTRLVVGRADEIYYSGTVTENEAQELGRQLKAVGYFTDRGVTVTYSKGEKGTVLGFFVNNGVWNDAAMTQAFENTVRELAPSVGGLPITIRLLDLEFEVRKEWVVR